MSESSPQRRAPVRTRSARVELATPKYPSGERKREQRRHSDLAKPTLTACLVIFAVPGVKTLWVKWPCSPWHTLQFWASLPYTGWREAEIMKRAAIKRAVQDSPAESRPDMTDNAKITPVELLSHTRSFLLALKPRVQTTGLKIKNRFLTFNTKSEWASMQPLL